jgi:hypothetical protein
VAPVNALSAVDTVTVWKLSAKSGYGSIRARSYALLLGSSISLG